MSQVPAVIRLPSVGGLLLLPTPVVASADSEEEEVDVVPAVIRLPSVGGLLLLPTPVVASADSEEEEVDVVSTFDNKQSTPDIHRNSL
ncbi:hypothetical protein LSTR_LSTR004638 [Laodelphax striatellus]|uniref:Secreted protein n=1 Tax=Laodelphax striatellus TaxID=195883 RepID=A0A482WTL9_LAOST|nr:hypothetical protein LSTR_LSTR004621 [Laodelphax striatellus]RZF36934.1 hypothetical protein LSTR_LSTR004622 [Laodelphax striatellus]RZF36935.1 hypothetical protein LSTR_LSTR004623 [Laodelphax striatellus]RZF36936.1 hypothetical protein LSTR_LSTR004624 [Laodelphax striatellus]RZF36937.1 hypothetical protein LSTR_LSTR004625 [Laodelphax striatellus]